MDRLPIDKADDSLPGRMQSWIAQITHIAMRNALLFARQHGLSMPQMVALAHVARHGRCSVSDLAATLGVSNAAASQLLDRLVHQGLVSRVENPADRRSKQLTVTEEGRLLLRHAWQARQAWLLPLVESLTPAEQRKVSEALDILIQHTFQLRSQ